MNTKATTDETEKHILIIEDNKDVRENTAEILELAGYKVSTAPNGKVGVDKATREHPHLIICDIMMPELDGYGVLHLLNKNKKTAGIPFIFLTAKAERSDLRKGMEMGADDYITKPFDESELLSAIEVRMKKTAAMQQHFGTSQQGINEFLQQAQTSLNVKLTNEDRETETFKKKQSIYTQGHRANHLFYIISGKVKTFKMNEDGKELVMHLYKEGDFFGYTSLFDEQPYTDHAEALEDCTLMLIPRADFLQLVQGDAVVARRFIRLLSQNLAELEEQLINLAYNSLRKRVANGLLQVFGKYKKDETDQPRLEIAREDLAQVVGTATESLIRTLSDFKTEKLIEIRDGKIALLNEAKLKGLAN